MDKKEDKLTLVYLPSDMAYHDKETIIMKLI
jgi:hypothetical protein